MDAIKVNELRVGNLVNDPALENPIEIQPQGLVYVQSGQFKVYPIPLTEEWATKLGFGNDIGVPYQRWIGEPYDKGTIIITLHFQRKQIQISSQQEEGDRLLYIYLPIPKYVHTLQNLYFALTGNELTTK
jgi:hypothetical protein